MSVRRGKFTEIPRIAALLVEAHKLSRYEGTEVKVDVKYLKGLLMNAMQRHGGKNDGSTLVMVSEREGIVEGVIVGIVTRIQDMSDSLMVTDLFFYQSKRANPADARMLLQSVVEWGRAIPKVFEFTMGCTDVVGDYKRTAKLYERMGFVQRGAIFGMRAAQ